MQVVQRGERVSRVGNFPLFPGFGYVQPEDVIA